MGIPEDRAEAALTCPTCGKRLDDPLELRTHELEAHGGEGPGTAVEQEDGPRPSVAGGSTPQP